MIVGGWLPAKVSSTRSTTATAKIITLAVPGWPGNLPGQHLDIRLTAEDGYRAERSYSIATSGVGESVELAVDRIDDGEVSPYLVDELRVDDEFEVKGPLGAYFVWRPDDPAPVQLIAGGSGIVPLIAIARAWEQLPAPRVLMQLLYSVRRSQDALYRDEVESRAANGLELTWAYTREAPRDWAGPLGRLTQERLATAVLPPENSPLTFVCGPTGFVEGVADALVATGHDPARILTERFGGKVTS